MKLTIFSTLCLGFSSAALAATASEEATHELAERELRDRLCGRSVFNQDLVDVESYDGDDALAPEVNLETRGLNFPGTCDRNKHMCYIKWTEGARKCRANCYCSNSTCSTNNGYCTYNDGNKDCVCT